MKFFSLFALFTLFMSMIFGLNQTEAQSLFTAEDNYFKHRVIHRPVMTAARGAGPTRFEQLHEQAMMPVPTVTRSSASSACPSNNALRQYQDTIRKINMLQETRIRAFWELQADYPTCVYTWDQIIQGNYDVLPYVSPNVSGVAHPADWMASGVKTMPNGMQMEVGLMNVFGYSHGTYCSVHPEKQVSPGYIQAVYINQVVCEGGFCHYDVTSQTATFEIQLPDGTVIPSFVANLTTVGWATFDSLNRINSLQADVRAIGRLSYIEPSFFNPFNLTRNDAVNAICFLATAVLCNTPTTNQFVATPFDPPSASGFVDCLTYMATLPTGDLGLGYGRNVQCKYIHNLLAADVPFMHCGHVGKSGAGQCHNRFIAGEGIDAQGNIDPSLAFDSYGNPYGPSYIEVYSSMLQKRAFDPRDPVREDCLDRRAMTI